MKGGRVGGWPQRGGGILRFGQIGGRLFLDGPLIGGFGLTAVGATIGEFGGGG